MYDYPSRNTENVFRDFFYAHGRPKEECQQKLTDARRTSRERSFPYSIAYGTRASQEKVSA